MKEKVVSKIELQILDKISGVIKENAYEIVDLQVKGGKEKTISLFLYKKEGFNIDQLGEISKTLNEILDDFSGFPNGFTLEVSSPGIYRKIRSKKEFDLFVDQNVKIVLNDNNKINGLLKGTEANEVLVETKDKKVLKINIDNILKAQLNG